MTLLFALQPTTRYRLRAMTLEISGVVPDGKVMWCRGRKVLGYGAVGELNKPHRIPDSADTACFSAKDYAVVMEQIA